MKKEIVIYIFISALFMSSCDSFAVRRIGDCVQNEKNSEALKIISGQGDKLEVVNSMGERKIILNDYSLKKIDCSEKAN